MLSAPRLVVFLAASAAILAVALLPGSGSGPPARSAADPAEAVTSQPGKPSLRPAGHTLSGSARRFLVAFTRYEVGDRSKFVTRTLLSTATPSFARALLREPPRALSGVPASARLGRLSVAIVSTDPVQASVGAVAHRPSGPEQLAFLFVRYEGAWLASAPGE